jgi:hypothetical protein
MIRHASLASPVGTLAQTMAESARLRLLVPAVCRRVLLLAAYLLSTGVTAVACTRSHRRQC